MSDNTVALTITCLCKANKHSVTLPKSSLPLQAHVCHCGSCRHISGSLYTSLALWPAPRSTLDLSGYKTFSFSEHFEALFCPTCSATVWGAAKDETRPLFVQTGSLENIACDVEVVRWNAQGYVGDTLDGGASHWLKNMNASGPPLKCFKTRRVGDNAEELPDDWQYNVPRDSEEKQDAVPIRCKCQGVHFVLHRNDYEGVKNEDLTWNVHPTTRKIKAEICGCDSCRLQGGTDVCYWTYTDMENISFPNDKDKASFPTDMDGLRALIDEHDPRIGSLGYYESSPNVRRYFCGTCSATIFYANKKRPRLIDIAVGVLEAKDGARAESMLWWPLKEGIESQEDGNGGWREGLFDRIAKAATEYGRTRESSG
ncbi:uncharacterized protein yc1106_01989 [Curvularia clavata]|uniref:CENP-V/GFA domain-containing protein n=1 Tax=Curvularia clavata TaxID=95742 RepID=A0A9Q8Z2Y6_CURCL|nr:uncharacterized protein yc1106_01989 [Curvularia clavata]